MHSPSEVAEFVIRIAVIIDCGGRERGILNYLLFTFLWYFAR